MKFIAIARFACLVVPLAFCLNGCAAPGQTVCVDETVGESTAATHVECESSQYAADPAPLPIGSDRPDRPPVEPDPDASENAELSSFDNFHAIAAGRAYRSAQLSPDKLKSVCREYGITTVINLRGPNPKHEWYRLEQAACAEIGVVLIDIAWSANHLPPRDKLLALYDALENHTGPLLLHCSAGADRTGAAAAIYRMQVLGDDRGSASRELSLRFGHIRLVTPKMDALVEMFQPHREWIEKEYPAPE